MKFSMEERYLFNTLSKALGSKCDAFKEQEIEKLDVDTVVSMAKKHAVLPLIYDVLCEEEQFSKKMNCVNKECQQVVMQSYRLLFLSKYVVDLLKEHGIIAVVLKGVATASFYPVPEARKSGDIDLLICSPVTENALKEVMEQAGFKQSIEQHANHHIVFESKEGIDIEIHTMLAEPFAYKEVNAEMEKRTKESVSHIQNVDVMKVMLPILDKPFHAYELLLHMFQHFVYAGFGLKLLCDWVVIWNKKWSEEEKDLFKEMAEKSNLAKFAQVVSATCKKYLSMKTDELPWDVLDISLADDFLKDIMDGEEFGLADKNRMVMMKGTHLIDYIREFHHQMHLNFPKAGKCFLLWPLLWLITLIRFLHNNRTIRHTSATNILKEAGRRSKLMQELNLL